MLTKSGIYQIRNTVNGKIYVGSSKRLQTRWAQHRNELTKRKHGNRYLQAAWSRYGESSFVFEPLVICSCEDLLFYEQRFIDGLKPAYNLSPSAGRNSGLVWSEAQKEALRKIKAGQAWVANMSASKTGSTRPDTVKRQISVKMQAVAADPEWREAMVARQTGSRRTQATRALQSEIRRKHYEDPANRVILSRIQSAREDHTRLELDEAKRTITEWAEVTGISMWAIRQRLDAGWSVEQALTKPNQKALIEYNGERKLLADWAREYGLKPETLAQRMKKWDMHKALTTPIRDWSNR